MSLDWTASSSQNWVSLSPANGTLAVGVSTTVTVSIDPSANTLAPGAYTNTLTFLNSSAGAQVISRPAVISVAPAVVSLRAALLPSGSLQITLQGQPFQTYVIEASADLATWSPIVTNSTTAEGLMNCVDPTSSANQQFYRGRSPR